MMTEPTPWNGFEVATPDTPIETEEVETPVTSDCECESKLADLTRAVEGLAEKNVKLTEAVNTVGKQVQFIVDQVGSFASQFQSMNPLQFLKGLTK